MACAACVCVVCAVASVLAAEIERGARMLKITPKLQSQDSLCDSGIAFGACGVGFSTDQTREEHMIPGSRKRIIAREALLRQA